MYESYLIELVQLLLLVSGFGLFLLAGGIVAAIIERVKQ